MVTSKRCKICTAVDESNIPISGQCFGKQIPELVEAISGSELDPRKLNGVLICQLCSIMMIHTDAFVKKLRKSVIRLKKPIRLQKIPRTLSTSKIKVETKTKKVSSKMKSNECNGDVSFKKIPDDHSDHTKTPDRTMNDRQVSVSETLKNPKRKDAYLNGDLLSKASKPAHIPKVTEHIAEDSYSNLTDLEHDQSQEEHIDETNNHTELASNSFDTYTHPKEDVSTKIKDLNCVLCGKQFNQKRTLREHIECSHMGEKLKECPNCFMEFRSVQKYDSHVFSEKCKTTLYPCQAENCNKRFKNSYKMENHMKEKHFSSMFSEAE